MSPPRPNLLVLTPSADLYGADRAVLLALPEILVANDVVLVSAVDGPMLDQARSMGAEVHVSPDWALRRRGLRLVALPGTTVRVVRSLALVRRLRRRRRFDLVYANTVANAMLPLVGRAARAPIVVHVREVPRDRGGLARVLFGVVDRVAFRVLCNSGFTASLVTAIVPDCRAAPSTSKPASSVH